MSSRSNVFVSAVQSLPGSNFNATSKLSFLWFDTIIVEDLGRRQPIDAIIRDNNISNRERKFVQDVILSVSELADGTIKKNNQEMVLEGYPRWERNGDSYYNYPEPETPQQYAHNELLKHFERMAGVDHIEDGYAVEQVEGSAKVAVDAVRLWALINDRISCTMACSENEHLAVTSMMTFAARNTPKLVETDLVSNVAKLMLPDVSKLGWNEIIAIKKHGEFSTLKSKIEELYEVNCDYVATAQALADEARRLTRHIAIKAKPKPIRALFDLVATNLPMGPVNPYAIFTGYKKFLNDCQEASEHKWIYTFLDLEERATKKVQ